MPNPLIPELSSGRVSVDALMRQPTLIRDRIAKLADEQILLPRLLKPYGVRVVGGGILHSVIKAADYFAADRLEARAPSAEYPVIRATDPDSKLALVNDFGGRVQLADEDITRADIAKVDAAAIQLANEITKSLDLRTIAAIEAAGLQSVAVSTPWQNVVTVGPETALTPSSARPAASWAVADELMALQELGNKPDVLIVHPSQKRALAVAYGENLDAVLKSAGLTLFANPRLTDGIGYVTQAGAAGFVGFEEPLTVEIVPDRLTRSRWVQAFCVPAFAITNPGAVIKLTGLS